MLLPGASSRVQTWGHQGLTNTKEESPNMYQRIQLKNTTTPIVQNSINRPPLRHRLVVITLALFSILAVCPTIKGGCTFCSEDTDGEIPFTVSRISNGVPGPSAPAFFNVSQDALVGRKSHNICMYNIPDQPCTFYRIKKTIFSHTGLWDAFIDTGPGNRDYVKTNFNVNEDTNRVDIKIGSSRESFFIQVYVNGVRQTAEASAETATEGVNTHQQSQAPSPTELGVEAWLGDTQDPSGTPDNDRWFFLGNAGDSLIVRLEPDNKGGNNGGHAILRFIGPPTKQVSGELPLRIDIDQLASTGRYDIEIEQAAGQGEERYRGGYTLTIESAQGTIHGLRPDDSVEK
jgi:hypothetical protein